MELLRSMCGAFAELLWSFHLWSFCRFLVELLRSICGAFAELLWSFSFVELLWSFCGASVELSWIGVQLAGSGGGAEVLWSFLRSIGGRFGEFLCGAFAEVVWSFFVELLLRFC